MSEYTTPMAHAEAKNTNAVESYLLNELTEQQRDRFEEHYFECSECADAVMAGQVLIQGIRPPDAEGKGLLVQLKKAVVIPAWRLWAMGGAVAASLTLLAVQNFTAPIVAMANTTILAKDLEKGPGDDNGYRLRTPSATVEVDPFGTQRFPFYRMTITRQTREIVSQVIPSPEQQPSGRLSLQVATKTLGKGVFTVTLEGLEKADAGNAKALAAYHFSIAPGE